MRIIKIAMPKWKPDNDEDYSLDNLENDQDSPDLPTRKTTPIGTQELQASLNRRQKNFNMTTSSWADKVREMNYQIKHFNGKVASELNNAIRHPFTVDPQNVLFSQHAMSRFAQRYERTEPEYRDPFDQKNSPEIQIQPGKMPQLVRKMKAILAQAYPYKGSDKNLAQRLLADLIEYDEDSMTIYLTSGDIIIPVVQTVAGRQFVPTVLSKIKDVT